MQPAALAKIRFVASLFVTIVLRDAAGRRSYVPAHIKWQVEWLRNGLAEVEQRTSEQRFRNVVTVEARQLHFRVVCGSAHIDAHTAAPRAATRRIAPLFQPQARTGWPSVCFSVVGTQ